MYSLQGVNWNRGVPLYTDRGVLTPGCWNRGVPLYTEVSSLQGVGIEGFCRKGGEGPGQ